MPEKSRSYVFALTSNGDRLDSWRVYANEGRGYSIGFDPEYLKGISGKLVECVYVDPELGDAFSDELFREVERMVLALPDSGDRRRTELEQLAALLFSEYGPRVKHISFSEERESRLVRGGQTALMRFLEGPPGSFFFPSWSPQLCGQARISRLPAQPNGEPTPGECAINLSDLREVGEGRP